MTVPLVQGRKGLGAALCGLLASLSLAAQAQDFASPEVDAMMDRLERQGVSRQWLERAMARAEFQPSVLEAMSGAAEHHLTWERYRGIFLGEERINEGAAFIEAHRDAFDRAEARYGVPPEVIAAIIGVETRYGRITGDHRVLDSLSTLAFHHPRRGEFFEGELEAFLDIAYQQNVDPGALKGSYAGAMGYPQFIPTSYQAYAVDFNDDGQRNLWTDPVDAIGSVANYFAEHRWQAGGTLYWEAEGPSSVPSSIRFNRTDPPYARVAELEAQGIQPVEPLPGDAKVMPLALDMEDGSTHYRLGGGNFYVITRYNHSHLYAMAVTELSEAIAEVRSLGKPQWWHALDTEVSS